MIIRIHEDLVVYKLAYQNAMELYNLSSEFPAIEKYALTNQLRRSSRSVCANIAEGFRRRRYPRSFSLRMNYAEAEASETQVWINFAHDCNYLNNNNSSRLLKSYDEIIGKLVIMISQAERWKI